ncbi:hypothetical protein THIOSC15_3450018 [uncultured Thiomicrorhabdus sp.]
MHYAHKELISLRQAYISEYRAELQAEGLAPRTHKIRTRFV